MNAKVEKTEKNIVKFEITVDADKFNENEKKAYFKNAKKYNVPGFRKGKAPMNIIKRYYGDEAFYEDTINMCIDETYPQAVKENNIIPVDYPKIDLGDFGENKEFTYTATVTVKPEVKLGDYKGVSVKKNKYEVEDEEIENNLKEMQEKNSRVEDRPEDAAVENGNIAVIDFKGFIDGKAFQGGEGKNYSLTIGSKTFIDNFEDQLVGMKVGETKDVHVKFPDNYGNNDLNGKEATFEVKVNTIQTKELPAIDDELAKEISEFDTLDEYKADLRKKLEAQNEERTKREYEDAVLNEVADNAEIEIPQVMVEKEIDVMIKEFETRLRYQGLDLESYYKYTDSTQEKLRNYMKDNAEKKVRLDLVLEKVAETEKIDATEEELKSKAEEYAKQYGVKDVEKTADLLLKGQKEYIKNDVVNQKVVDFLVSNSVEEA